MLFKIRLLRHIGFIGLCFSFRLRSSNFGLRSASFDPTRRRDKTTQQKGASDINLLIENYRRSRFIMEYLMLNRKPFFSIFYLLFTVSFLVQGLSAKIRLYLKQ
jgi:hypothetical protein